MIAGSFLLALLRALGGGALAARHAPTAPGAIDCSTQTDSAAALEGLSLRLRQLDEAALARVVREPPRRQLLLLQAG